MSAQYTDLLDCIGQIIRTEYKEYEHATKNNTFSLREDNPQATCREAKFKYVGNILVYKFDQAIEYKDRSGKKVKVRTIFPFFTEGTQNAMCDFIAFYAFGDNPTQFFGLVINMKSSAPSNNIDQLNAGSIFSKFLLSNAAREHNKGLDANSPLIIDANKIPILRMLFSSVKPPLQKTYNTKQVAPKFEDKWYNCATDVCDIEAVCTEYLNSIKSK